MVLEKLLGSEFVRVMSFMKPRIWRYAIGMLAMTATFSGLSVVEAYALKYVLDATVSGQMQTLVTGAAIMLIGALVTIALAPIFRWMYNSCAHLTAAEVRLEIFSHLVRLPISYFERSHSGDIISRITSDTTLMVDVYTHKLRRFLAPTIYGTISAVAMLLLDWRIACVLILFNFLSAYVNTRFARPIRRVSDSIQQNVGTMTEKLIDLLAGFSIIRLFHLEQLMVDFYEEINREATELSVNRRHVEGVLDSTNFLLSMISNLGTVGVGSYLAINGITDFGNLLALINLQANLNRALLRAGSYLPQVQESLAGAGRVFELLDEPVEPERCDLPSVEGTDVDIELRNVIFGYEHSRHVLKGFSMSAERGQIVALVGPSGGGKSTALKILLGFYRPQAGGIVIGGKPIGSYTLKQLRERTAYVPQDAYLFDGTIEENIRYGRLDASDEEVEAAARAANAHEFILEQPDGYQTIVGERGMKLSGGQRQRIAIARALLRDAPMLLLDEATSSLDSKSEQLVQQALNTLMMGRTTFVVAHRLSTIQHADTICVIDDGRIVEQGNHYDLVKKNGLYNQLYETQFESQT